MLMNLYLWGNTGKATKSTYLACPICPKFNPGKPIKLPPGHFNLPNEPLEVWQMDFIQMPSHGYKYILVIVCMFSN